MSEGRSWRNVNRPSLALRASISARSQAEAWERAFAKLRFAICRGLGKLNAKQSFAKVGSQASAWEPVGPATSVEDAQGAPKVPTHK